MSNVPADLQYTRDHQWVRIEGSTWTCGLTQFAADQMGDVVFVELAEVDHLYSNNEACGTVESAKSVSPLYMPAAGRVVARNEALVEAPEYVNTDPYGDGWIFAFTPNQPLDADPLMRADEYEAFIREDED